MYRSEITTILDEHGSKDFDELIEWLGSAPPIGYLNLPGDKPVHFWERIRVHARIAYADIRRRGRSSFGFVAWANLSARFLLVSLSILFLALGCFFHYFFHYLSDLYTS